MMGEEIGFFHRSLFVFLSYVALSRINLYKVKKRGHILAYGTFETQEEDHFHIKWEKNNKVRGFAG